MVFSAISSKRLSKERIFCLTNKTQFQNEITITFFHNQGTSLTTYKRRLGPYQTLDFKIIDEIKLDTCNNGNIIFTQQTRRNLKSKTGLSTNGLVRITGTHNFNCFFETKNGASDAIYNLKGPAAIGDTFYVAAQSIFNNSHNFCDSQNQSIVIGNVTNTNITVEVQAPSGVLLKNPITNNAFNISTFTIPPYSNLGISNINRFTTNNSIAGTKITVINGLTDQNAIVTVSEELLEVPGCADLIGDQLIPNRYLGKDYIVQTGDGSSQEKIQIITTEDNTLIKFNGCISSGNITLNKQKVYTIDASSLSNIYINANKRILVYHLTGFGCEIGASIIAPVNCKGSKSVVIRRSNSQSNNFFATTIRLLEIDLKKLKFERYRNGQWETFYPSTVEWNTVCMPCEQEIENCDLYFKTAKVNYSLNELNANELLRITSLGLGPIQVGAIFNNSGSTTKYGFFSSFDSIVKPYYCLKEDTFCKFEKIYLKSCDSTNICKIDLRITLPNGTKIFPNFLTIYPNSWFFKIDEYFYPYLNKPMQAGKYIVEYKIESLIPICDSTITCSEYYDSTFFYIRDDLDTLYFNDTITYCVSPSNSPFCKNECAIFNVNCDKKDGFRFSHIHELDTDSIIISSSNVCLKEGNYLVICEDTINCTINITKLNVIKNEPIIHYDSVNLSFCSYESSLCDTDNCAKYVPDNSKCVTAVYTNTVPPNSVLFPNSGTIGNESFPDTMCFGVGQFWVETFDKAACRIYKTLIKVGSTVPDTVEGFFDVVDDNCPSLGYINYQPCLENECTYAKDSDGNYYYPNQDGVYSLYHGNYVIYCLNNENCTIYQNYFNYRPFQSELWINGYKIDSINQ